jgi:hypothetical protein
MLRRGQRPTPNPAGFDNGKMAWSAVGNFGYALYRVLLARSSWELVQREYDHADGRLVPPHGEFSEAPILRNEHTPCSRCQG